MKRLGWFILAGCLLIAIAIARRPSPDLGPPAEHVVRIYDVSDLLNLPAPQAVEDENAAPAIVPASRLGDRPFVGIGSGGNSAGGGGLFGSGGSGGRGASPDLEKMRLNELAQLVSESTGINRYALGNGCTVTHFGCQLVVVQTRENHQVIRALLQELRTNPPRQLRLDITWATLRPADLTRLIVAGDLPATLIDDAALQRLPGAILWRGHIICTTGQRTHLTCGRAYTIPTEIDATITQTSAAFGAKSQELLDGATIDVQPALSPDAAAVTLDLRSDVTRFGSSPQLPPFEIPVPISPSGTPAGGIVRIDRLNLGVQTLASTTRGPAGKSILIGGATDPDAPATDPRQLYLIIRATPAFTDKPHP